MKRSEVTDLPAFKNRLAMIIGSHLAWAGNSHKQLRAAGAPSAD